MIKLQSDLEKQIVHHCQLSILLFVLQTIFKKSKGFKARMRHFFKKPISRTMWFVKDMREGLFVKSVGTTFVVHFATR